MVVSIPASVVFGFLFKCALVLGVAYLIALWIAKTRGGAAREALGRHGLYVVVFFAAFTIYLGNGRRHLQVDTVPPIYGAISLVETGSFAAAGRKLVVYFYPKDNTSGCTSEGIEFRDLYPKFRKAGTDVVGVSPDTLASHDKFKAKYEFPFELLADVDRKV